MLILLFTLACEKKTEVGPPQPPSNLRVEAANNGESVSLQWDPSPSAVDSYFIYFRSLESNDFVVLGSVTSTSFLHNPSGNTGTYYVTAFSYDGGESYPSDSVSTIPVHTDTLWVYEFDDPDGPAGYGWDKSTGQGERYPMSESSSIPKVDFNVTDTLPGQNGPYFLMTPDFAPYDRGAGSWLPEDGWRKSANGLLPVAENNYVSFANLIKNSYYAVNIDDGNYYAVLLIRDITPEGTILVESWFQLVPGLRLLKH
jgi:hypothetical protein